MSDLATFVEARLADSELPPDVKRTYERIIVVAGKIRSAGKGDDWLSWLTGTEPAFKVGEYLLGADPATGAARFSDQLLAILADTWREHPDFDPKWSKNLPKD